MKKLMKLAMAFSVFALLFTACEKDKFTEEDALNAQQTIDVVISVLDKSNDNVPVDSAIVTALINGELTEQATDVSGAITFSGVKIGATISVFVTKDNYLDAYTSVSTNTDNYRQGQVSANVYLYNLSENYVARIKGRLTLESDLTNREREPAAGVVVKAQNTYLNDYAEQYFFDSTDANGNYEILVPVTSFGSNNINVDYPNIYTAQRFAKMLEDGTVQIVERIVEFQSNTYSTGIGVSSAPSAYLSIDAPSAASLGSGFQLGAAVNPSAITTYSSYELVAGGSGFFGGADSLNAIFYFNPGVNGDTAFVQVDIEGGSITNIDYISNNGALYTSKPSVQFTDGGTGAEIAIYFQTTYDIYVANAGSGYLDFPQVALTVQDYDGSDLVLKVDDDINDNADNTLGVAYAFNYYADIVNGTIKADNSNGDTLFTSSAFSAAPQFEVFNETEIKKAVVYIYQNDISSSDSSIFDYDIDDAGFGYDPLNPPTITVNSVGGLGSGAILRAEVGTNRQLTNIEILQGGDGYVQNVNDHKGTGNTGSAYEAPSYPQSTFYFSDSGETFIQDVFYGTGYRVVEEEEEQ